MTSINSRVNSASYFSAGKLWSSANSKHIVVDEIYNITPSKPKKEKEKCNYKIFGPSSAGLPYLFHIFF